MIYFDIGANVGKYIDVLLSNINPQDTIIAVEANDELCNFLSKKYSDKNVIIENCLLSEKVGYGDFYICNANTISTCNRKWIEESRFSNNSQYYWNKIQKETSTLDVLISKYGLPEMIKIDVEGHEKEVLNGLNYKIDKLCFEYAEELYEDTNKCIDKLKSLGYIEFAFTINDMLFNDSDLTYSKWEDSEIHTISIPKRKELWGMIWAR